MDRIYLDHNATTPVRPEAVEAMIPFMRGTFGNASSTHAEGQAARRALEDAREKMADFVGAEDVSEIIFTSGGTEANNMALQGGLASSRGKRVISSAIEHSSVRTVARWLGESGRGENVVIPCNSHGIIDPADVEDAITPDTALVSIMAANNEVGTLQPVKAIADICKAKGVRFHTDAVQLAGKAPVRVNELGCDMLTLSAHKFGAPKGTGILYLRRGTRLTSLLHGGMQEKNRRGGTENVPGIVAMGVAAELAQKELTGEVEKLRKLRDLFESLVLKAVPKSSVNGDREFRICNTTNICFEHTDSASMLMALDLKGVACSSGSACAAGSPEPSHVLLAMGLPQDKAHASLRFSLGHGLEEWQIRAAVASIAEAAAQVRKSHPLWKEA
ncbi:MAG: cysteine desulfurase [Elusimicrobia bacterium]|nr:cysteine desulfurase [Elusimicrobiota bacterium]